MHSPCLREAAEVCFHGCYCCTTPFLGLHESSRTVTSKTSASKSHYDFKVATVSSIYPFSQFTNHESLPSVHECFSNFTRAFPQYSTTNQADKIRENEYYHLSLSNHVCLDYIGHGLFSYSQQQSHIQASTSAPPLPPQHFEPPFFDISYKSVSLNSQLQYAGPESDLENRIRKRIMAFMNISEDDYTMAFTANQSSAFKLLAECYPFQSHKNLLTVYDYENEAVKMMIESSKKKGAQVISAEFLWPTLTIQSGKLQKKIASKRKTNRGLFVFPLQSITTGARYSYFWMSMAQQNGWHVLLDACALGPKDMETLGLSLFKPDFLICSFFKVFGENPSGFACLFVKKSSISVLKDSISIGIVRIAPAIRTFQLSEESSTADMDADPKAKAKLELYYNSDENLQESSTKPISEFGETKNVTTKHKSPEIEEILTPLNSTQFKKIESNKIGENPETELEFRGLDNADTLGLLTISARTRYLVNWLVNALLSLQHPHSENGQPPVRIYGPRIKFDRGPAVAFNIFDWKGEKIEPAIVQKLADRSNISLSYGYLDHIWFTDNNEEERIRIIERRTSKGGSILNENRKGTHFRVSVVTASVGFLTNFEDVYKVWTFVSRFLDADFVEKERWRYTALNQNTVEV